ncbi:hypothetical protein CGQ24_13800 [Arthrobacter sp. 7749]|nr:hypothetical protein CGQ24_13800 [Arthrobacter sp. 7749]
MEISWDEQRRAFTDAALWFERISGLAREQWEKPGLGEWDIRALVGHTSRALLTVETYLEQPATTTEVTSAAEYFRAARTADSAAVAARGHEAGRALGSDPAASVAELTARVIPLLEFRDGTELITTIVGGMQLCDYLPTRTFELTVHTADLCVALGVIAEVPDSTAAQALAIVSDLAISGGLAGPLLLAATGRASYPAGFSVL